MEIFWKQFEGKDKVIFLEQMSLLWDKFEEEDLSSIIGFECYCGEAIKIKKILG